MTPNWNSDLFRPRRRRVIATMGAALALGLSGPLAHATTIVVLNPLQGSEHLTLLTNGSFEANSSGIPLSWSIVTSSPKVPVVSQVSQEQSYLGSNSAKISGTGTYTGPGAGLRTQVSTTVGQKYVLGAYFFLGNITTAQFYADINDDSTDPNVMLGVSVPANTWVFAYDTFTAQRSTTVVRLIMDYKISGDQYAYVDGVSVTPSSIFVPPLPVPELPVELLLMAGLPLILFRRRTVNCRLAQDHSVNPQLER